METFTELKERIPYIECRKAYDGSDKQYQSIVDLGLEHWCITKCSSIVCSTCFHSGWDPLEAMKELQAFQQHIF